MRFAWPLLRFTRGAAGRRWPSRPLALVAAAVLSFATATARAGVGDQPLRLEPSDVTDFMQFGASVAVGGRTVLVGAASGDGAGPSSVTGTAYLFDAVTGAQRFELTPSDPVRLGNFGGSVALSGNLAAVGASAELSRFGQLDQGSAYLFDATTGRQLLSLSAPDTAPLGEMFGSAVAVGGNTLVVGARGDAHAGDNSGAAYVFDAATGRQLFKLTPSDGHVNQAFGYSAAVSGNTAIIGAGDGAYLFDLTTGGQLFKLAASDGATLAGNGVGLVDISGNRAIAGAFTDDKGAGAAFVFDATTGRQLLKLTPPNPVSNGLFGETVAISGDLALVTGRESDGGVFVNKAYLFDLDTGELLKTLASPDDPTALTGPVGIGDGLAVVGARNQVVVENGSRLESGAAYVFAVPEPGASLAAAGSSMILLLARRRTVAGAATR
jgi:FG-GAP repeat